MSDAMKRDNLLTAEIDRLRARVAELEAAGDALAELLGRMKPDRDQATADAMDALDGWRSVRGKLRFSDGDYVDYLPPGQWLVAMENCQQGHTHDVFGDPCICGSDNCVFCVRCGVEHHD